MSKPYFVAMSHQFLAHENMDIRPSECPKNRYKHLSAFSPLLNDPFFKAQKKKHFIGPKSRHSIGAQAQGIIWIVYEHADMFNHNIILYIIIYISADPGHGKGERVRAERL